MMLLVVLACAVCLLSVCVVAVKPDRKSARAAEQESIARENVKSTDAKIPQASVESGDWYDLEGPGSYGIHVAGTSQHQDTLLKICGGKRTKNGRHKKVTAAVMFEPDNPHDRNAVRVEISSMPVGHLPREIAPAFREATKARGTLFHAKAMIVGGWSDDQGEGSFGVRLDI